ncbi:MAG: type II toxin-antitoxin system HicA family toxin [Rubrivivax sp.]|nr:type II toxin-antitoxin system HicA family toxin [Rubrivivax sp.]
MNSGQQKVLAAIFVKPTLASIVFADIESLVRALGGIILARAGSRVSVQLMGEEWRCHRPHPGKEAKRYQVEQANDLLDRVGVRP